ncbi:Hemolymph lipopolysaccharide-binding protein [Gryllus bimaculatus]|nr:Hemolymph lipopolysaccharide-binding protein [Gryllus bimaculatus]
MVFSGVPEEDDLRASDGTRHTASGMPASHMSHPRVCHAGVPTAPAAASVCQVPRRIPLSPTHAAVENPQKLHIHPPREEDNYIRNQMKPGWIHIGIHHLFPDRGFTTVLGNPVNSTGFNTWLSGHSVRNVTNNCGFINKSRRGLGMGLCNDRGRFICEISFG